MAAPTLVIGVGGTGVRILLRVKERLLEVYDEVPSDIMLYELDTDDYKETKDTFNGVGLQVEDRTAGIGPDQAEFFHVATKNVNETMDTVFERQKAGELAWQWVNERRLRRTLNKKADFVIKTGAHTVRPVGRSALFLVYDRVYRNLQLRLQKVVSRQEQLLAAQGADYIPGGQDIVDDKKATVFVVASAAGGSGAGMVIDILRMLEHMRTGEIGSKSIAVMALLVGGGCFTDQRGERTDSNTFATLRELDRLGAVAGRAMNSAVPPVMWSPDPVGRFSSQLGPADMILLFDKPDRLARDRGVSGTESNAYLEKVIAPSLADLILAFADERIAPAMRTVRADMADKWETKDPRTGARGYFPYASAGIHTLIFPERDVRKSAGLRLLLELWDDYLVRSRRSDDGAELEPATRELWGVERASGSAKLTPYVFTDEGFARIDVCKGAVNNNFIRTVVISAISGRIQLPSDSKFLGIFGGKSMVQRVVLLVGLPNMPEGVDQKGTTSQLTLDGLQRMAGREEEHIDRSIAQLDRCRSVQQVRQWRLKYLGEGHLGNERGGEWIAWLRNADSVRGHSRDFRDVLWKVCGAILNDAYPNGLRLPHRLEYAEKVLDRLEKHILRWTQGDPEDRNRGSLLSEYFGPQIKDEEQPRDRVNRLEPAAARSEKFNEYLDANKKYAKAKKELVGMHLLEVLCEDLLREMSELREKLRVWQRYLQDTRRLLGEEQTKHEEARLQKAGIPVRTYLVDRPSDPNERFFKDGDLEKRLYKAHHEEAADSFCRAVQWIWQGDQFYMESPFGVPHRADLKVEDLKQSMMLSEEQLVRRAIQWACTRKGNPDRPDDKPPFRDLGSSAEVNMAVRIRDYFGPNGAQALTSRLTSDIYLASLCPLDRWPRIRLMYTLALPITAQAEDRLGTFTDAVKAAIESETAPPNFANRRPMVFDPENLRHALAAEFAVGFKLEHRTDQQSYLETYFNDNARYFALHCMPEEERASAYYELEFMQDSKLYAGLGLNPMTLDPAVVDLLGDKKRLELFTRALMCGAIGQLPAEQRKKEGPDYYLWPDREATGRIRLSKMKTPEEINAIVEDLAITADMVGRIVDDKEGQRIINRLRLMYALRTFVLLEHDVDRVKYDIGYPAVETQVNQTIESFSLEQRVGKYAKWVEAFLNFYKKDKDERPMLAHLGLVLARVANDLRRSEEGAGGDEL